MMHDSIHWRLTTGLILLAGVVLSTCGGGVDSASAAPSTDSAKAIIEASGIKGGLVVVIGCGNARLLEDLHKAGPYLIHGLDDDPAKVAAARKRLLGRNIYGPVTVSTVNDRLLPYVDSLVNMIVLTGETRIPPAEMTRTLCPKGVIVDVRKAEIKISSKHGTAKLDEWTHYLYDATNNAVSKDTLVGPPHGIRWTCGPKYARSHEHMASVSAMVSAGGRIFYIIDEGPISSVYMPPKWSLIARDAFSGVLLWKKPITNWESHLRGFRSGPPEIGRLLVARGQKVYVALGYAKPVSVLDAATGKETATLPGTGGARELLLAGKRLYVLADDMTSDEYDQRKKWIDQTVPKLEIIWRFPRTPVRMYGTQRIAAINTATGKLLWKRQFKEPGEIMPTTLAIDAGKVCLQTISHVVCLNASDGKDAWAAARPVAKNRWAWSTPTLVIHDGVVLTIDRAAKDNVGKSPPDKGSKWIISSGGKTTVQKAEMYAFALDSGKKLWTAPYFENYNVPQDVFVINGAVWTGAMRRGVDPGFTQGRDLKTGKITATITAQKGWGHHRCYRNKATVRWIIMGRGGMQFVDPKGGPNRNVGWARGACQYGIMPANGLIYTPQHSCACNPESLITGLNALSPQSSAQKGPLPLQTGRAFGKISGIKFSSSKTDWPTYRKDARRSAYQDLPAPRKPHIAWTTKLHAPITAPVSAGGAVFVAETDRHTLCAMSAADGRRLWTFTADGRIDSPPTLSAGLCVFGTRNGAVYCLRASDGALVWRFGVSAGDRRIFSYGQVESVWPVHGSVLVDGARVYFAAGRSSSSDGGIHLLVLELKTGKVVVKTDVHTSRGAGPRIRRQMLPDILSLEKGAIWMRGMGVDKNLKPVEDATHLFAPRGFLDDTWWHRTYWIYGEKIEGGYTHWPDAGNVSPSGRLLAFDGGRFIYGYGRMAYRMGGGHVKPDMTGNYKLFAEIIPKHPQKKRTITWTAQLPFVARAIVLTRDAVLAAGGKSPTETPENHGPGTFWAASRENGAKTASCALPAPPVLDGMAITDAGVFVSTIDGAVIRLKTGNREN
ncbi:MAG: PQQ-binding-like beta-propeller repeat protein [Phycisphaerae bacterium]|jgi:outer membrane protein assembly factor BamB|nr:PQQ-binding-like beta-propeller repeat protein [Phycisphaerae bacterium]